MKSPLRLRIFDSRIRHDVEIGLWGRIAIRRPPFLDLTGILSQYFDSLQSLMESFSRSFLIESGYPLSTMMSLKT